MASQWWSDDSHFMAALSDALDAERAVPRDFVEAGKAAYTWRGIDTELAALTHDSEFDDRRALAVRAQEAGPRFLTFISAELTIELEIISDAIIGQIVPSGPGQVDVCPASGDAASTSIDEIGCFVIRPIPPSPFRLRCHTGNEVSVSTSWITL